MMTKRDIGEGWRGSPYSRDVLSKKLNSPGSILVTAPPLFYYIVMFLTHHIKCFRFPAGTPYDLFLVAIHEFGHSLGLDHSVIDTDSVMTPSIPGSIPGSIPRQNTETILSPDDIAGIQALYGKFHRGKDVGYDILIRILCKMSIQIVVF